MTIHVALYGNGARETLMMELAQRPCVYGYLALPDGRFARVATVVLDAARFGVTAALVAEPVALPWGDAELVGAARS